MNTFNYEVNGLQDTTFNVALFATVCVTYVMCTKLIHDHALNVREHFETLTVLGLLLYVLYITSIRNVAPVGQYMYICMILTPVLIKLLSLDETGSANIPKLFFGILTAVVGLFVMYQVIHRSNQKRKHLILGACTLMWTALGASTGSVHATHFFIGFLLALHAREPNPYASSLGGVSVGMMIYDLTKPVEQNDIKKIDRQ